MKKTLTESQVRKLILAECEREGSQQNFADKHGVSRAFVSDVINGKRTPTEPVLTPLKIKRLIVYEQS